MALRVRGETVDEISGAVATIGGPRCWPVKAPADAVDIVGTGGDASGSYNVSTCAGLHRGRRRCAGRQARQPCALLAIGQILPSTSPPPGGRHAGRARRGHRDRTGSDLALTSTRPAWGFMFAPAHHSAMGAIVGPSRVELGTRTILQPARTAFQPGRRLAPAGRRLRAPNGVEPLAHVLKGLGAESVWVVHGDGLDEMDHHRRQPWSRHSKTARSGPSRYRPKMSVSRGRSLRTSRAATPGTMARALKSVLAGRARRLPQQSRCSTPPGR